MARPKGTEDLVRTTITIPRSMLQQIEIEVLANKQQGRSPASVSAVVREALERRKRGGGEDGS